MVKGSNRSTLWDHFVDVLVVLIMEAALGALMSVLGQLLPSMHTFLAVSHRILTWLAILIVTQFAVCSLALLTARNWTAVRKAWKA